MVTLPGLDDSINKATNDRVARLLTSSEREKR